MVTDDPEPAPVSRQRLQHQAARGAAWTMLATGITIPAAFGANVVLARVLDVDGYGRLAFLTMVLELAVLVADIGTAAAVVQFGSRAHAVGDRAQVRRVLAGAQGFRLLVMAPVLTIVVVLLLDLDAPVLIAGVLLGVWVPAATAGMNDCLAVENRSAAQARLTLVTSVLTQAVVIVVALASRDADTTWIARLALAALTPAAAVLLVDPAYRAAVLRPRSPRGMPPGFWRFAVPTAVAGVIGTLVTSRSELLLLQWLGTSAGVGLFALAFGVTAHLFGPANALTNPLLPAVSGLRAVDPGAVERGFLRVARVSTVVVSGVLAVVVPVLAVLIDAIYGRQYADAAPLTVALSAGVAASTLTGPVTAFSFSRLRGTQVLGASLLALAVDVVVALALIPMWGAAGAAIANVAAALVRLGALLRIELIDLRLGLRALGPQIGVFAAGAGAAWAGWWASAWVDERVLGVLLSSLTGGAAWWLALHLLGARLEDGDRQQVLALLPRRLRPGVERLLAPVTRA